MGGSTSPDHIGEQLLIDVLTRLPHLRALLEEFPTSIEVVDFPIAVD